MLLTLTSCWADAENATNKNRSFAANPKIKIFGKDTNRLLNSQFCMVNNKFMNKVQIAIFINDKTYYGCWENSVKMLKENNASRFATDPQIGEKVDKAIAVIILNSRTKRDVLYFKSEK